MKNEYYAVRKENNTIPTWLVLKHSGHDMAVIQARFYNEENAIQSCNLLNGDLRKERLTVIVHKHHGSIQSVFLNRDDADILEFETHADYLTGHSEMLIEAIKQHGKVEIK